MEDDEKVENKVSGSGFLIFRKDTLRQKEPLMLALIRDDGIFDIPKGSIDKNETSISAAKRECFEECSIIVNDDDMLFNEESHIHGPLEVFCASTDKTPLITRNPESGIKEHEGFVWVTEKDFCNNCLSYLTPAINHFYSSHSRSYNNT